MIYEIYTTVVRGDELAPSLHTRTVDGRVIVEAMERARDTNPDDAVVVLVEGGIVTDIRMGRA